VSLRKSRVHEYGNFSGRWDQFVQRLQPLRLKLTGEQAHARDIAARPIEAGDQA
jgi:hypothetical protein